MRNNRKGVLVMNEKEFLEIFELNVLIEAKEDRYPRVGPFYYYQDIIIAPEKYQRRINPITMSVESIAFNGSPLEHRDMWDNYMLIQYPELKIEFDDDHKALPRGRVDYEVKNGKLSFFITLDRCITNKENEIVQYYYLSNRPVSFSYGTMNYKCKDC